MTVNFNDTAGQVIRPVKLAHFVLRTRDKDAMTKFYTTFLGGFVQHENPVISFISYDDEHHRIALAQLPKLNAKDTNTCGLEHVAFTFDTLEDLLLSYRQRRARGITPFWCINHGITISLYYKDPDGNVLETQYDVFTDNDEANEYMVSEAFATNPVGAEFDPEDLIQRMERGEPLEKLIEREDVGPRGLEAVPTMRDQL